MILSTTPSIEGKHVIKHLGIVTGEAIIGANIFKDFFAGIRDIVGGRTASYERVLRDAKNSALEDLTANAQSLGANAVLSIDLDYETIGAKGSMLMVSASGTAVVLE